jgi:hypothetical protein
MSQVNLHDGSMPRRAAIAAAAALIVSALAILAVHGASPVAAPVDGPRADIIRIDGLKQFGRLERTPVTYLHEKHTQALAPKGKDCAACHLREEKYASTKYMRLADTSKAEVMAVYHTHCTACHRDTAAAGEKAGPVVCTGCHRERAVASSWRDIGMDKSLHARHVKAQEKKCEACHHEAEAATGKLFYAKGREGTCRYCHLDRTVEKVRPLRLAAHQQCIECHRQRRAQNQDAGPSTCSGCHDAAQQQTIEKLTAIPRLERGQPDAVLVQAFGGDGQKIDPAARPHAVAFNHLGHETYADNCRVCHHASMAACASCHTQPGSKPGKFVNLQTAMHRPEAAASCIGCHASRLADKACAGCHAGMPRQDPPEPSGCASCHVALPAGTPSPVDPQAAAARLLEARRPVRETFADADIPETVVIRALSRQYEPVKLPHRKIVRTLVAGIRESRLAGYFHRDPGTVCQGCHHHSPAARKPPACASCHGQPFDGRNLFKPGLQAAYHLQCMECHRVMGIEKPVATNCTGCHKEKL